MSNNLVKEKYNKDIVEKYQSNYEKERWFKDDFTKTAYQATKDSILFTLPSKKISSVLELGPGHGTWTKFLFEKYGNPKIDFVDISKEMLKLLKSRFEDKKNLQYFESDFLDFNSGDKYDLFFSIRAIEYIEDKKELAKKIFNFLNNDGQVLIVSKTPKYLRMKLVGKKVSDFHSRQVSDKKLKKIFQDLGAKNIKVYPVTFVWPFWRSAVMDNFLFKIFGKRKINFLSRFFSESYLISFLK